MHNEEVGEERFYFIANWGDINDGKNWTLCEVSYIPEDKLGDAKKQAMIKIRLDLKHGEIRFSINDIDGGIAFKDIKQDKDTKYRLCVTAFHEGAKMEIISFQRLCK